jgi:hypothetical protein
VVAPGNAVLPALLVALGHHVTGDGAAPAGEVDAAVLSWDPSRGGAAGAVAAEIERMRGAVRGGGRFVMAVPVSSQEAATGALDETVQRFAIAATGGSWRIVDEPPDRSDDVVILTAGTTRP